MTAKLLNASCAWTTKFKVTRKHSKEQSGCEQDSYINRARIAKYRKRFVKVYGESTTRYTVLSQQPFKRAVRASRVAAIPKYIWRNLSSNIFFLCYHQFQGNSVKKHLNRIRASRVAIYKCVVLA